MKKCLLLLALLVTPVFGATLQLSGTQQYTDTSCASFTLGTGSVQTLSCSGNVVTPPPVVVPPVVPPVVTSACAGFTNTRSITGVVPANRSSVKYFTSQNGGFGANDAIVFKFVAPPADPYFQISFVESGIATMRTVSLSKKACDFGGTADTIMAGETGNFGLDLSTSGANYAPTVLVSGQTYYLNIANRSGGLPSCTTGAYCEGQITISNPSP